MITGIKVFLMSIVMTIIGINRLNAQSFTAEIIDLSNGKCSGVIQLLNATPGDISQYTYEWTCPGGNCPSGVGAQTQVFMANNNLDYNGFYSVKVTEIASGDFSIDTITISTFPAPDNLAFSPSATSACEGDMIEVSVSGLDFQQAPFAYLWSSGSTNPNFSATVAEGNYPFSYTVVVTNAYGCTGQPGTTFWISGSPAPEISISSTGPTAFCAGGNTELVASVNNALISNVTLEWKKYQSFLSGAGNDTLSATSTGRYRCVATMNSGLQCSATSNYIDVTAWPLPPVAVSPSGSVGICTGQSVILNATAPAAQSFQWVKYSNPILNETSSSLSVNKAGTYKVIVTDGNGCSKSSAKVIVEGPPKRTVTINGYLNLCPGDSVILTAMPGYSYEWKRNNITISGANQQSYAAKTTGRYKVLLTNNFNCTVVSQNYQVTVSNTFCNPQVTRLTKNKSETFTVFPNPFEDHFTIAIHNDIGEATIELLDISGKLIFQERVILTTSSEVQMALPNLDAGVYLVRVRGEDGVYLGKIVKN